LTPHELRSRHVITVTEAAAALEIGRTAAYEAVRHGDLPSLRLGRRVLIPTAPLLRLLGHQDRVPAEAEEPTEPETGLKVASADVHGLRAADRRSGVCPAEV
jgi:excisionase family DNA binding protein